MNEIVRLISGDERLMLSACDGKRTIAQATDVFWYIDVNFQNWGTNVTGEATLETLVAVYELTKDADFAGMFTSLNGGVGKLVLIQDQILDFIERYKRWLRKDDWATFFPFQAADQLFVASVYVGVDNGLRACVDRFGNDFVRGAAYRHRLVVPKL